MKQRKLYENVEEDSARLKRLVPASIKNLYVAGFFDNDILTNQGEALELFRLALNRIEKEQTVVKITAVLFPYLMRDLDRAFKTPSKAMTAYKTVYSLLHKINFYDEWKSAIDINALTEMLERNKSSIIQMTLKEVKEFLQYESPGHPTTVRVATMLRNLRSVVDWPELKTMYLSMHNVVFNYINTKLNRHDDEDDLVDYIWRNKVDLSLFPKIRDRLDLAKDKILTNQIRKENSVFRGIGRTKLWVEHLKEIGLDWPELDDVPAVYNLAKPFIITTILRSIKELKPGTYGWSELLSSVNLLISYEKLNWPELKVIKYSLEKGTLSP